MAFANSEVKPRFHVAPPQGWINDPNGPLYYGGYYHMFYQYVETGCQWSWGLLWGHAVSRDLVTWQHLPPALSPTFGGFDGDGCFSGCATLDENGVPTILYTGVRLRSSDTCGPMPPPECDLGNACIETQCIAFGDPADPKLTYWTKDEVPFLSLPPPNMNLTAWRDPYVIGRPGQDGQDCWTVMVGAGIKERGGTALVYKAQTLRGGSWSYAGELCRGSGDTGVIWECPVMLKLPRMPAPPQQPPASKVPATAAAAAAAKGSQAPLSSLLAPGFLLTADSRVTGMRSPPPAAAAAGPNSQLHYLDMENILIQSPASPRPPLRVVPRSPSAAVGGRGDVLVEPMAGDNLLPGAMGAMVLSPRPQSAIQAPLSPLRSPARWNLPALHPLPHAPSPPAPRPSVRRSLGSTSAGGPFSPAAILPETMRRTPPPSPRPATTASPGQLRTHGSPATPIPPRSPAGAVAALLSTNVTAGTTAQSPSRIYLPVATSPVTLSREKQRTDVAAATAAARGGDERTVRGPFDWTRHQTFFCICPDDCNSMSVYYLGSYDSQGSTFDLSSALGPFPIDLGDVFYAPNTLTDPEGRSVLWGWLQEKPRKVGTYDYAGCLSMPRMLFLEVDEASGGGSNPTVHLVQRPPPDIAKLRVPGSEWLAEGLLLESGSTLPVPLACGHHVELELSMAPLPQPLLPLQESADSPAPPAALGTTNAAVRVAASAGINRCSGVLLHSWRHGVDGAAALLYHWDSGVLEVVFEAMDPATLTFSLAAPGARRVGGKLMRPPAPGSPLELRVFLDYSCLEVFTGNGEVLTARVYRGSGGGGHHHAATHGSAASPYEVGGVAAAGVELVSFGCSTEFQSVGAYEMGTIWVDDV